MPLSPLHRKLLPIALPTILMNISIPLLGAVDTAVVGHLDRIYFVGAVGIGSLIFSVLYWAFAFLRTGVIGLVAQHWGRGDGDECAAVLWRGLALALALGLVLIAGRRLVLQVAFYLIDASPDVEHYAEEYVLIRILAAPAAFIGMVFTGWFYGMKNVALPVAIQVGINGLNVALDFLFVMKFGLLSEGVAWATVIAQYAGLAATLALFTRRYGEYWGQLARPGVFGREKLLRMFTLNTDLFIRNASLIAAHSYFLARSATHGNAILAANTNLVQFRHLTAYGLDGFAVAAEVLVGSAMGSGRRDELRQAVRLSLLYGLVVGAGVGLFYFFFRSWLLPLFTANAEVLALAANYMMWIVAEPLVSNVCFMLDGIFIGATATRAMRNAMLVSVIGVYFPLFWWLEPAYGNHGMWATTVIHYAVRSLTLAWPLRGIVRGGEDGTPG